MQNTLLTGIKPTGNLHLGNYFGAVKPLLNLLEQNSFDRAFAFIANYHALNSHPNPDDLKQRTYEVALDYLAFGFDPERITLFVQADVPEHAELAWLLSSLVTVAYLERSHAYKDAVDNGKEANAGLFMYPVLMASDILLYDTTLVPVGQDQKQHIEIAQTFVQKFNHQYGQVLTRPNPFIQEEVAVIKGLDGRKMSKSYGNTIEIFEPEDSIRKKVMKILTDSKRPEEPKDPDTCNIMAMYRLVANTDQIEHMNTLYREGEISYKEAKEQTAEKIIEYFSSIRNRRSELAQDPLYVTEILRQGAITARAIAQTKIQKVRQLIGLE